MGKGESVGALGSWGTRYAGARNADGPLQGAPAKHFVGPRKTPGRGNGKLDQEDAAPAHLRHSPREECLH
eukprot:7472862-Pyramimonas_sp.AAC.1